MAKKSPPRTPDDTFDPQSNGTVKAVVGGHRLRLRRPTVGEQRDFVERLEELSAEQQAFKELVAASADAAAQGEARPDGVTAETLREKKAEQDRRMEAELLAWWRRVFDLLDPEGAQALPADDLELPMWLLAPGLTTELRKTWLTVPWGPGGSPTQREAKQTSDLLRSALGAVPTPRS